MAKPHSQSLERSSSIKRRCVSSACIACRKRKSKVRISVAREEEFTTTAAGLNANVPGSVTAIPLAAPPALLSTTHHVSPACYTLKNHGIVKPCQLSESELLLNLSGVYDPASDHRRKGVYKKDIANLQNRNATLQTLIQAILTYDETDVIDLIRRMRSSKGLEEVATSIIERQKAEEQLENERLLNANIDGADDIAAIEYELSGKMNQLRLDGSVKLIGGTSNLLFLPRETLTSSDEEDVTTDLEDDFNDPITRWTNVQAGKALIIHLLKLYFTWHAGYFTVLCRESFERDFYRGHVSQYCSPLLVNAILAIGCHYSSLPGARGNPSDPSTVGDHFFSEAKKLILENDEYERAKLCTVQALALMSVREAGCGREGSGWVYSGMSFRMALDLGLNVDPIDLGFHNFTSEELDTRRVTFWGCFLIDKYWSNYLGRQAQLTNTNMAVAMFDVYPEEEASPWVPYTDSGVILEELKQPSRVRTISQQMIRLSEISDDLLSTFYHPAAYGKSMGRHEQARHLNRIYKKLENWKTELPKELQSGHASLPAALLMHPATAKKICSQAAFAISESLQIYKEAYGLHFICPVAVYTIHSACTIHLLSLPEKAASLNLINGIRGLEIIAEGWPCARRALRIIDLSSAKWSIALPDEAEEVLQRTYCRFGPLGAFDHMRSATGEKLSTVHAVPQDNCTKQMSVASMPVAPTCSPPVTSPTSYITAGHQAHQHQTPCPLAVSAIACDAPNMSIAASNYAADSLTTYQPTGAFPFAANVSDSSCARGHWTASSHSSPISSENQTSSTGNGLEHSMQIRAATVHGEQQLAGSSNYWWLNDQAAFAYRLENQRITWETPTAEMHDTAFDNSRTGVAGFTSTPVNKQGQQ
ncbi:hypothetical protein KEM54_005001, partial [Ascosphaera aggregata]